MADRGMCAYVGEDEDCQKPVHARVWCSKHYSRHPETQVRNDVKRRMSIRENYIEDIDPIVLADMHGWVCGICDDPIDPTLAYLNEITGKPNDGYRTVDHIIAVSRGGEHSYANARPAHWICNVRRWTGEREVA